ncbi:hypothetical protein AB3H85_00895 [Enterococcus sp. C78]|jgi:hypothetical protein|uniref:hypothetical protein n=1 Tax=Enterococcus sp. C78 TaxID=3231336 RepID=UPI0034A036B1
MKTEIAIAVATAIGGIIVPIISAVITVSSNKKQNKLNIVFQEKMKEKQFEMEQKKIDADIIAKSRISWIDTTKEILSEFINDVEKFFPHLIEVLQRVKDLEDDMIDKDMQIEINKLFDQVSQHLDIIHKNSMLIKLNFSDSEEHAPIIDVIDRIVYEINFSSNYRDENRSEITERELNSALDKKSEVFNETKRLVQLLRVYYKNEWEKVKLGK